MKSYGGTIQVKPLQQYFHMILFILYVVLLSLHMKTYGHHLKISLQQYFHISSFALLYSPIKKRFISAWWYLFFRVLRKEVRFSVQHCSAGTLGKENDICIQFLCGGNKMILTKRATAANAQLEVIPTQNSWG